MRGQIMRRRQLFADRERQIMEENTVAIKVPNANIISNSAQEPLKEKANMFLPHEKDIVKPNGTPFRKKGSKPGAGARDKTLSKNRY